MRCKIAVIILCLLVGVCYGTPTINTKLAKKILYVGYSPQKEKPIYNDRQSGFYPKEYFYKEIDTRMNEFKYLLEEYFTSVSTVDVRDYKQEMSKEYDVTIFDALPEPITKMRDIRDEKGKYLRTVQETYLDASFHYPTLFIGHTGGVMQHGLNLNIDWYCLCLNSYAHSFNLKHKIFNSPFKTSIKKEVRAVPQQAYSYLSSLSLPATIDMWQVQKTGYRDGKKNRVGLVSNGPAFKESPDSEYISGGESLKSIDAAAIARHANFFLWGFAAAPSDMTDQAKVVFANSVAYISEFKDSKVLVRKPENTTSTDRSYVSDLLFALSEKGYPNYVKQIDRINKSIEAQKSKVAGGADEKYTLKVPATKDEFYKKRLTPELFEIYKADQKACYDYVKSNMPYFYGFGTYESFVVDKDAKELGIANNNSQIVDKAIQLLEEGTNCELAERILNRYTTERFSDAAQWRKWYQDNLKTMFFSETAGYLFITEHASQKENIAEDNEDNPVTVTVSLDVNKVRIKFIVKHEYQIYAMSENSNSPFFATKIEFDHSDLLKPKGEIVKPKEFLYDNEGGIFVYKGAFEFVQEFDGTAKGVSVIISYQCCNSKLCMSPVTQTIKL